MPECVLKFRIRPIFRYLYRRYKSSAQISSDFKTFKLNQQSDLNILLLPMALQTGVGLGLLYNMPPGLSIPFSVSPFVYSLRSEACYRVS